MPLAGETLRLIVKSLERNPAYLLIFSIAISAGTLTAGAGTVGICQGNAVALSISFASLVVTLIAAVLVIRIVEWAPGRNGPKPQQNPYRAVLNFGHDDLFIVFPPRDVEEAILPRVSVEDFLAIRSIQESLNLSGWRGQIRVRDSELFYEINPDGDKKRNIVAICSPKTNRLTAEILDELAGQNRWCPFGFEEHEPGKWHIRREPRPLESDSYEQEKRARGKGLPVAEQRLNDVGVLAKFANPWNPANMIIIAAGIRGIGTWGATDHLRRNAADLFGRKTGDKTGEFVAYLDIVYRKFNLVKTSVRIFEEI